MADFLRDTRRSYDAAADDYADWIQGELATKPLDRAMLTAFADVVDGPVADIGCGTGRITAFLRDLGVPVFGVDLSPRMVAVARRAHPDLRFTEGSMTALDIEDGTLDFHHRRPERVAELLAAAGLTVRATLVRAPDGGGDHPEDTPQAFVLASG